MRPLSRARVAARLPSGGLRARGRGGPRALRPGRRPWHRRMARQPALRGLRGHRHPARAAAPGRWTAIRTGGGVCCGRRQRELRGKRRVAAPPGPPQPRARHRWPAPLRPRARRRAAGARHAGACLPRTRYRPAAAGRPPALNTQGIHMNHRLHLLLACLLLLLAPAAAQDRDAAQGPRTGDPVVDARLADVDRYAARYPKAFIDELVRYFDAPRPLLEDLLRRQATSPGDLYYACALARVSG